jgi:acyl-CoA thioesterase
MMDTETARKIFSRDRYAALAGIEIVDAGEGFCTARMRVEDKHLNSVNIVHGGAIFTLADLAFAVASNSRGMVALAINAHISFLQAVSSGMLTATATEVDEPGRLGSYDVVVTAENGNKIAVFSGMVYRKNQKLPLPDESEPRGT